MTDTQLRQDVLDELEFEPSINAANVGAAVKDGVVTLTGHVSSYSQKITAEVAARRVRGVRAIAQEMEVRYAGERLTSDDEIAKRALDSLRWSTTVPDENVKLTVDNGWITLNGEVDWQFQKMSAENAVRNLLGVIGVSNLISVKPRVQAADIKGKIEAALKRRAEVEANAIRVSVVNDKVTLNGSVDNWDEREAVENAAWSAPGVRFVEDHLTIGR